MHERSRRGKFLVSDEDTREAERAFQQRSKRSRAMDKAFRAPIARDLETWKNNQRGLDFPGVDTPRDDPQHGVADFPTPTGRAKLAQGRGDVAVDMEPANDEPPLGDIGMMPDDQFDDLKIGLDLDLDTL